MNACLTVVVRRNRSGCVVAVFLSALLNYSLPAATVTWIGGNVDWTDGVAGNANWSPADEPDADDTAVFNTPNSVDMGSNNSIQALTLSGGIDLMTNGQDLTVNGAITASGAGTNFLIDSSESLVAADTVALNAAGTIEIRGGTLAVDEETGAGFLDINAGGTFSGFGAVNLNDAPGAVTSLLINDGTLSAFRQATSVIQPPPASTLTINAPAASARINLDGGAEAGVVSIFRNQTLDINGALADAFSGDLNMFHETTLDVSSAWSMDGGTLDVVNGQVDNPFPNPDVPAGAATIAGGSFTQTGGAILNFSPDGTLIFAAPFTQSGGTLANNGRVVFNANATIGAAANMTMPTNTSSITVGAGAVVNVDQANFDVDGNGAATNVIRVNSNAVLDLDLGAGADDTITGAVILGGGELDVTTLDNNWSLGGSVSTVLNSGASELNGETLIFDGASVAVAAGSTLDVNAVNAWEGGTSLIVDGLATLDGAATFVSGVDHVEVSGTGTLRIGAASTFTSATTRIEVATFDWDGVTSGQLHTISPQSIVRIDSANFDSDGAMDDAVTLGAHSNILVNGVAQWEMRATLTGNGTAAQPAFIGGDARLVLTGNSFIVNGDTLLELAAFGPGSTTSIGVGAKLAEGFGVDSDFIYDRGSITGFGTLVPAPGDHNTVAGNFTISVDDFDFDTGDWVVNSDATLVVSVSDYDTDEATNRFEGTITLDGGSLEVNTDDAEFVMDGTLIMNRPLIAAPAWKGEPLNIGDDNASAVANVFVNGASFIEAPVTFHADANVVIAAGHSLVISNTANFDAVNGANDASFTGAGALLLRREANFNEATTFDMSGGAIEFDGNDSVGNTINVDAPLVMNVETFADFGNVNTAGGPDTITVDNNTDAGVLTVNLDDPNGEWTLNPAGVVNLNNNALESTLLAGSDVNIGGVVNVAGDVRITARVDVGPTGAISIQTPGEPLRLGGGDNSADPNTIAGGTISGVGVLSADAGRALAGFGTINAPLDFEGAAELVAHGGLLEANAAILDVGALRVKSGATLDVAVPFNTTVTDSGIVMEGGALEGAGITIDPAPARSLRGFGMVENFLDNRGAVEAQGGTLVVHVDAQTGQGDLDGATNAGRLRVAAGANLAIREESGDGLIEFAGAVDVQNGGELFADFAGGANATLDFASGSSMTLTGATFQSNTITRLNGSVIVNSGPDSLLDSSLETIASFNLNGAFTLNGNLQVKSRGFIPAGAAFSGPGALHLLEGSRYTINHGADVDVVLINDGRVNLAELIQGRVDVADYQQSSAGSLVLTLQGVNLNDFDRLIVDGTAVLAGALDLNLVGGFVPSLGDAFPILSATGGVLGGFTSVSQPANMPAGLLFDVVYSPTLVQLMVVSAPIFSADFDVDGDVDGDDLTLWQGQYGEGAEADADSDGDSDGADFLQWQRQFGSVPAVPAATTVPEPSGLTGLVYSAAAVAAFQRRRSFR